MKINNLPIGTKLMWDAPLPFVGYVSYTSLDRSKILYTAIVSERGKKSFGTRINTGIINSWMGNENDRLRFPTEEELEKYEWPTLK